MDVFSTELGIWLSFVKISEFERGLNPQTLTLSTALDGKTKDSEPNGSKHSQNLSLLRISF
jgi:hypothetical protein